jgi:hypothetical protein
MLHDIDYLRFAEDNELTQIADEKAIRNADFTLPGIVTKLGLTIRKIFLNNSFNKRLSGMSVEQTQQLGEYLLQKVRNDPQYQATFRKFDVEL